VILALASTLVTPVYAQPAPEGGPSTSAAATERARKLHFEAARLFDEGKFPQAYVAFVAAWAIKKHPSIAGNLADCEVALGKYRDAAEHFRYIVKDTSGDAKPADKRRAQERLDDVAKRIGALSVTVTPSGAELALDGAPLGKAPLADAVFVDPGQHTLEGQREGYLPSQVTFTVTAGSSQPVKLALATKEVSPPPRGPNPSVLIAGGAGAGAGIVLGAVFAGISNAKASSAASQRQALVMSGGLKACSGSAPTGVACSNLADAANAKRNFADASFWSFVGAGAVGAGILIYALTVPKSTTKAGLHVIPIAGPKSAGIEMGGAW
jgi:hypothetical protein